MPPVKRRRTSELVRESSSEPSEIVEVPVSDGEVDISSTLISRKPQDVEGDDDDDDFIRNTMAKHNVKSGTDILKKTKGKNKITKGEVGGGSFQSMGLHPSLLRSLTLRGYRVPTPIQRLTIPSLLSTPPRDVVGMARTGSGKTLAYMIPLIQRLGGRHATTFGARALIMLPARELALQVLKVGKELARGWNGSGGDHAGDAEGSEPRGQTLRWGLVVGGEGLDEQFEMITSNPDVIIATPGRLLHLAVEMNMDLRSIQYVVFDEADRLFEMGFATALDEILSRLPSTRQTLLFSATLPKTLVEFAKAGLQNPKLVRLDADSKISADLRMAFFSVKQAEKDACLLLLLRDVIGVPLGSAREPDTDNKPRKGKSKEFDTAPHQTLIFVATKHHVEYLSNLLTTAGYAVSHIYGALDQVARSMQMDRFRRGYTSVLVVTDVAARGIDIPVLENVVNYDFPQGARVFIHRVGRTARAGRKGWAWTFVTHTELPHMLDLQLFLGRPIRSKVEDGEASYIESLVVGTFERDNLDEESEYVRTLHDSNSALPALRDVMRKGQSMYERSQGKASQASYKRAKDIIKGGKWILGNGQESGIHPILAVRKGAPVAQDEARNALLRVVNSFRPSETVFEVGSRGQNEAAALMQNRRKALGKAVIRAQVATSSKIDEQEQELFVHNDLEMADEADIEAVFETSRKKPRTDFKDSEFYMSHRQKDALTEKGYSLRDGASFAEQANQATFDLTTDEGVASRQRRNSQMTWDKKKKKFVKGGGAGADNVKLVRTESGTRLPATYRSGRFDEWKANNRTSLPRVGEAESENVSNKRSFGGGRKFKHMKVTEAKPLDKLSLGFERKQRKKQGDREVASSTSAKLGKGRQTGRYGSKPIRQVKTELKTADQIRRARDVMAKKKAKNARPSRKKGKR
ncbi:ATP-dependent RNA helicase DBP10 [Ramaria rubella]|nr:ATP-dependent RNA helicase DBP10 [Ramaria rubella]